jgi:hypothetical protein
MDKQVRVGMRKIKVFSLACPTNRSTHIHMCVCVRERKRQREGEREREIDNHRLTDIISKNGAKRNKYWQEY